MCRTVVVGEPSAEQVRKLEAVEAGVGLAIAAIRPGVTVGAIRDEAAASVAESGYGSNWWGALCHTETAQDSTTANAKEHPEKELKERMVLCIEPGITVPGPGRRDDRTDDRRHAQSPTKCSTSPTHEHVGAVSEAANRTAGRGRRCRRRGQSALPRRGSAASSRAIYDSLAMCPLE